MPNLRYPAVSSSQTTFQRIEIIEEPHPPPNESQALYAHWPSVMHLSTKALKQQCIAREISVEVDKLANQWKPHGIPDDPHFRQGQIVIGPAIGVGEKDFRYMGAYYYMCEQCDYNTCPNKYHPWTRSLSEEQILQNDILTPLLLMREELRPKHRLEHKQLEEDKRITIRHSHLYIAAAQKYYNKRFKDASWFQAAVQRYIGRQAPTPSPSSTHTYNVQDGIHERKRNRSSQELGYSLPNPKRAAIRSTSATSRLDVCVPKHLSSSPLPPADPLDYNGIMSEDDMKFKPIAIRSRGNPIARLQVPGVTATSSFQNPKEVIELTDSESCGDSDEIDWEDQVPFTIIIWTSSADSYEDLLLYCHTGITASLASFKMRLTSRGIDLTRSLETYNPSSAKWVSIHANDMMGPFTTSRNKPRVFLLRYEGVNILHGFDMFRGIASEIPMPQKKTSKGKTRTKANI